MKILVTGAAGFIGFHLTTKLLDEGHSVVGLDSINDYYEVSLKLGRLKETGIDCLDIQYNEFLESKQYPNYRFVKLALEDETSLLALFELESFDVVINLAAQAGVRYSIENPHAYIASNISGFLNVLECSRKFKIKHLIYASSSSVYGLNENAVFSTNDPVDHPVSLYAATKRSNELMAHVYSNMYSLPVTGLRFFTVYGPWGRPDMAPMLFSKAILSGEPISVFNNGDMRRDFTYISDIVEGIYRLIGEVPLENSNVETRSPSASKAPFAIYNIGNSNPTKLLDFIEILEKALGRVAVKKFMPMQPGDVYSTYADASPLMKAVGYRPNTSLEDGIRSFADWYKKFYCIA